MVCGDRASRRRAHIGQIAIVQQDRINQPGFRRKQDHQPVQARQAQFRVVEKAGADLDREPVKTRNIGGLYINLTIGVRQCHGEHRRHDHLAARKRGKCLLHNFDCRQIKRHKVAQIMLGEDLYGAFHAPIIAGIPPYSSYTTKKSIKSVMQL